MAYCQYAISTLTLKTVHACQEWKLAVRAGRYYIIATVTAYTRKEQETPRGNAKTWDSVIHYPLQLRSANADDRCLHKQYYVQVNTRPKYQASSLDVSRTAAPRLAAPQIARLGFSNVMSKPSRDWLAGL